MGKCVFWYPRTSHSEIKRISELLPYRGVIPISDIEDENCNVVFRLRELPEEYNEHGYPKENIEVYIIDEEHVEPLNKTINDPTIEIDEVDKHLNDTNKGVIVLKQRQTSRNGLVKYEYDDKSLPNMDNDDSLKAFWYAIYHNAKGFYHLHEFHLEETDSILSPYLGDCNIKTDDNDAIHHYIDQYLEKFEKIDNVVQVMQKDISKDIWLTSMLEYQKELIRLSYSAEGDFLYCKSLLSSKYFKNNHKEKENKDKELRIRGYINKINIKKSHIQNLINLKITKRNRIIALISVSLGILSLYLAVKKSNP